MLNGERYEMKILISIEHPAWAHQFKYLIRELEKRRHIVNAGYI